MSIEAQTWAWKQVVPNPSDKLVLVALADNAGHDGTNAFPSLETLAKKTGLARRTVWASLHRLESAEFIRQDAKPRQHKPAVYSLCLFREATVAPLDEPSSATTAPVQSLHPCNQRHPEVQPATSRGATVAPEPYLTVKNRNSSPNPVPSTGGCAKHQTRKHPNCRRCRTSPRAVNEDASKAGTWCGACDEKTRMFLDDEERPSKCSCAVPDSQRRSA